MIDDDGVFRLDIDTDTDEGKILAKEKKTLRLEALRGLGFSSPDNRGLAKVPAGTMMELPASIGTRLLLTGSAKDPTQDPETQLKSIAEENEELRKLLNQQEKERIKAMEENEKIRAELEELKNASKSGKK